MAYIPLVLAASFTAFCVWLTVRTVNRRERWARWTLVALIGPPVLFVVSLGPTCWMIGRGIISSRFASTLYYPFLSLEFHAPHVTRQSVSAYARLWDAETALAALRDEPVWRNYPVCDLMYRQENGARVFYSDDVLYNMITTSFDALSWEDCGGPGTLSVNTATQSLDVLQSRRVHGEIATYLDSLRARKQSAAFRGRELDLPSLFRALAKDATRFPENEIRADALVITPNFRVDPAEDYGKLAVAMRSPAKRPDLLRWAKTDSEPQNPYRFGPDTFANADELLEFLECQPRSSLRGGILVGELEHTPGKVGSDHICSRVKTFCESRDLDLFIRPTYGEFGNNQDMRIRWVIRASDSLYSPD